MNEKFNIQNRKKIPSSKKFFAKKSINEISKKKMQEKAWSKVILKKS